MRRYIWVLAAYCLLSLVLTWPLAAHFGTHVPGDGIDDPSLAWNLWWVKHAFVDQPQNPFAVDWQFWPVGVNLAFYTLTVLNGLLAVPLQAVLGLISAYNILLLSSYALGGLGAYLLCLDLLRSWVPSARATSGETAPESATPPITGRAMHMGAFIGGMLYAFAAPKLFYAALGQANIASSQWAPFAMLYIIRLARPSGRARHAVMAGLFLVLQAYAELTYASFLSVFAGLVAVWHLLRMAIDRRRVVRRDSESAVAPLAERRDRLARWAGRFALLAFITVLGISPILANMLPDLRAEGDLFASGGGFADVFSADLAGYMAPTQLHPILGGLVRGWSVRLQEGAGDRAFPVDKGQQVFLGWTAMVLAAAGFWCGRRRAATWFWAASGLLFFVLTLGPSLRLAGWDSGIPLPFRLLEALPFFKGNRYPSRYSVMLLASMAPLVAAGVMRAVDRGGRLLIRMPRAGMWAVWTASAALLLFEHVSAPLPLSDLRVPAVYDRVAAEPGEFALLELPLGWRNGARVVGKADTVIMRQLWYQSWHGKRLLGGNTSRNPEFKFQYFSEDPILARLIALTHAADSDQHAALRAALAGLPVTAEDRARAGRLAAMLDIRYVMVHRDELPAATEALARALWPLTLVAEEEGLALYRVAENLTEPQSFQPGADDGRLILAEGWSAPSTQRAGDERQPALAQRADARLLLPLPAEAVELRLDGWSFAPGQQVTLVVNGEVVGRQALPQSLSSVIFALPDDPSRPVLSDVRLRFTRLVSVEEWGLQNGRPVPAGILVRSAGEETGDFAHIYVNGTDHAPNRRGYNLVAMDRESGRVVAAASFDTHADPAASGRLAAWVRGLPPGTIVAGAVRDEASSLLGGEAIDALRFLGAQVDLRGQFRWGHAFLGEVGAAPGEALEASDGIRPAQVSSGIAASNSHIAAALLSARIDKY